MTQRLLSNYLLVISIVCAAVLRVVVPWGVVFRNGQVVFTEVDTYYFMHVVDEYIKTGASVVNAQGVNYIVVPLLIKIIAFLSFGQAGWVSTVAAFVPAICGVLLVIPVYFVLKKMFGIWAGALGAMLVATLQGDLLARTSLGFTDHHCLEALLPIVALCCIVYALKDKMWLTLVAGISLGLYALAWRGAALFLTGMCLFMVVQSIISHYNKQKSTNVYWVLFGTSFVALCIYALRPIDSLTNLYVLALLFSCLLPIVLYWLSRITDKLPFVFYPVMLAVVGGATLFLLWVVMPDNFSVIVSIYPGLAAPASGITTATEEARSSFLILWNSMGVVFIFGMMGLVVMMLREGLKDNSILFVVIWTLFTFALALIMRRFIQYVAPMMVISTAYLVVKLAKGLIDKAKSNDGRKVVVSSVVIFCCFFMLVPNTVASVKQNLVAPSSPTTAWLQACNWIRYNTPDTKDYTVLAWWDYGYWILQISKRNEVCDPGGGNRVGVAACFTSTNSEEATKMAKQFGARYIIIDYATVGFIWGNIQYAVGSKTEVGDSFAGKLWNEEDTGYWDKVWESTVKYGKDAQVKIFKARSDYGKTE